MARMTADYDPLALPATYFEGLPTGVPSGQSGQPEAVEVLVVKRAREAIAPFEALIEHDCEACGWCDVRNGMTQEASRALNALMAALLALDTSPAGGTRQ